MRNPDIFVISYLDSGIMKMENNRCQKDMISNVSGIEYT